MKGATADPSVNTKREPNNTRKMIIGANHHFLRTFMNSTNSRKSPIAAMVAPGSLSLELPPHVFRAPNPIRLSPPTPLSVRLSERILSDHPHDQTRGRNYS